MLFPKSKKFIYFNIVKSKTQYIDLIKNQEERNVYDFKKMINDFEAETRHNNFINGIKNKWRVASSKYLEKIQNIKIANKKADNKKLKDFKKRYKTKELSIKHQLELNRKEKIKEKNKRAEYFKMKNKNVENNLDFYNKQMEQDRLRVEENTMKKSN